VTPADTARLLAKVQAYDGRTVGQTDVAAWYEALGDVDLAEALDAVAGHFRASTDWLMPAHIRSQVRLIRAERRRLDRSAVLALPSRFETDAERAERISTGVAMCRAAITPEDRSA
jgi:hypothetical protein